MRFWIQCLLLLGVLSLASCSDFHFVGVSNGSLPPEVMAPDTIRIPADSIVVRKLYSANDTMFQSDAGIRAGARVVVPFRLTDAAWGVDSLFLYGSVLSDDTLRLTLRHDGVVVPLDDVGIDTAGGFIEHRVGFAVVPSVEYEIAWTQKEGKAFQMGALLLVGYGSRDSTSLGVVSWVREYRESILVEKAISVAMEPGMIRWAPIYPAAGDSLVADLQGPGSLTWQLVDGQDLDAMLVSGSLPSSPILDGSAGSILRTRLDSEDARYFVIANLGGVSETYSDSVELFRLLADEP